MLLRQCNTSLIKMSEHPPDANTTVSKLSIIPVKRKRRPIIPNKNGVDRIHIVSRSETRIEIKCRFLYRDENPINNIQIRITLPRRKSIRTRILARYPNIQPGPLSNAITKWIRQHVTKQLRIQWNNHRPSRQELFIDEDIIGVI